MDSDLPEDDAEKFDLFLEDVSVFDWDSPNAFEEQIFFDVPTDVATQILDVAVREHGYESVKARLACEHIPNEVIDDRIQLSAMEPEEQKKIGTVAKKKKIEWYKRIDLGEMVGNIVFENWESIKADSKLKKVVDELSQWVIGNDRGRIK